MVGFFCISHGFWWSNSLRWNRIKTIFNLNRKEMKKEWQKTQPILFDWHWWVFLLILSLSPFLARKHAFELRLRNHLVVKTFSVSQKCTERSSFNGYSFSHYTSFLPVLVPTRREGGVEESQNSNKKKKVLSLDFRNVGMSRFH